jgi:hypothetical protein
VALDGKGLSLSVMASDEAPLLPAPRYVSLCAEIAERLPGAETAVMVIQAAEREYCRIEASLRAFRDFAVAPPSASQIMVIAAMMAVEITSAESEPLDDALRYRGAVAFNVAHSMMVDVARLSDERGNACRNPEHYLSILNEMSERASAYRSVVHSISCPPSEAALRNTLIELCMHFDRGVRIHLRSLRQRRWDAFRGRDKHFWAVGETVLALREETLEDARKVNGQTGDEFLSLAEQ